MFIRFKAFFPFGKRVNTASSDLPRRADDEEYQADPELSDAARAHTGNIGQALKHLDDAINLVGVLLDAAEHDDDARGAQARTVLESGVECIHEAHRCVEDC